MSSLQSLQDASPNPPVSPTTAQSVLVSKPTSTSCTLPPSVVTHKLMDIRKHMLDLKEKPMRLSKHPSTIADLSRFFSFRADPDNSLDTSYTGFDSLIAKIIQESSATLVALVRYVADQLCPTTFGDQPLIKDLPLVKSWLESCITRIASRSNYRYQLTNGDTTSSVDIWRWEVSNLDLFQPEVRKLVEERMDARQQAHCALVSLIESLSPEEQAQLFASVPSGSKRKVDGTEVRSAAKEVRTKEKELKDAERQRKEEERNVDRKRKEDEKIAERQRKEDEKTAEKQRKEDEKNMERAMKKAEKDKKSGQKTLAGFVFSVPKEKRDVPDVLVEPEMSDYALYFRLFHVRDNATVSPLNPFWRAVDARSIEECHIVTKESICKTEFISFCANKFKRKAVARIPRNMDVDGDQNAQRLNRPWKLIGFAENIRPAYFGTWSKVSKHVTGRRPFSTNEPSLDYDVDSEEEWEEDEPGEELKSEDEDEDDEVAPDEDEDENQWLVPHGYLSDDEGVAEETQAHTNTSTKTRVDEESAPKRKKLVYLVPVVSGPCFGGSLSASDPLLMLSVQVIGDCVVPIDPLKARLTADDTTAPGRKTPKANKSVFPEEHLAELIQVVNGRESALSKLVDEIKLLVPIATKAAIEFKIRSIAVRKKLDTDIRPKWYVSGADVSPAKPALCTETQLETIDSEGQSQKRPYTSDPIINDCDDKASYMMDMDVTPSKVPKGTSKRSTPSNTATCSGTQEPKSLLSFFTKVSTSGDTLSMKPLPCLPPVDDAPSELDCAEAYPEKCLEMLLSKEPLDKDSIMNLSPLLLNAMVKAVSVPSVAADIKSKCLHLLGDYITVVEAIDEGLDTSDDASTLHIAIVHSNSVFSSPEFVLAIEGAISLSEENNVTYLVVKDALRLVALLLQSKQTLSRAAYNKFQEIVSKKWMLLIGLLLSSLHFEVAEYATDVVAQSLAICDDPPLVMQVCRMLEDFICSTKNNEQFASAVATARTAIAASDSISRMDITD
ncbi:hypothetical protein BASA62_002849 [Batrachochytrium salamandrivorans]|nr:hypothetical protein BASA62_002849 [Batrachochytrium salamandrivorans]